MQVVDVLKHGDLGSQAQTALHTARGTVAETVSPHRLRDLAEHANADRYRDRIKDLEKQYVKRARRLERKLEKQVKKLPVDTPLDRRRRVRERRRGATGVALVVIAALGAAIGYATWRARRDPSRQHLDRFDPAGEPTAAATAHQGNGGAARQRTG